MSTREDIPSDKLTIDLSLAFERSTFEAAIHWILRIGCFMCFVGHGAFGVITKEDWVVFFYPFGISRDVAYLIMPFVGCMDITLGVLCLLAPRKAICAYMTFWCTWTAFLRPLVGMGWWEFLERGGNYGVPLALFVIGNPSGSYRDWFRSFGPRRLEKVDLDRLVLVLRIATGLLMIGHGGFGLFVVKDSLIRHYEIMGLVPVSMTRELFIQSLGLFEIIFGLIALAAPFPSLLLFICVWKISNELLYPLTGEPVFEFIERGGSYAVPLALALTMILRSLLVAPPSHQPK